MPHALVIHRFSMRRERWVAVVRDSSGDEGGSRIVACRVSDRARRCDLVFGVGERIFGELLFLAGAKLCGFSVFSFFAIVSLLLFEAVVHACRKKWIKSGKGLD